MRLLALAAVAGLVLAGCGGSTPAPTVTHKRPAVTGVPRFAHIVVVIEENRSTSQVLGAQDAPYLNELGRAGAVLTHSYGIRHPSQPNYLALFSGSTQGLTDDSCPHTYHSANLATQLLASGRSFAGYSESLPAEGYRGCSSGAYVRKHAPWTDFAKVSDSVNRPLSALPKDWSALPTVAFVIPNLDNDMHDGTVRQADDWLRTHLGDYATWARSHDSLLVVTWDEDDFTKVNRIPGVLAGAHVRAGRYGARIDHYTMLRTIEAAYGLSPLGAAAQRKPVTAIWTP